MGSALGALAKIWSSDPNLPPLATDTIYAEKIQSASDGKYRMVVYMSGMDAVPLDALAKSLGTRYASLQNLDLTKTLSALTPDERQAIDTLVNSNFPAVFNNTGVLRSDVQTYIDDAYKRFNTASAPIVEIELVGHSNGGQTMKAYASAGTYKDKVTSLVVFGSPLTKKPDELGGNTLKAITFRNFNDPVPWLSDWIRAQGIQTLSNPLGIPGQDLVAWDKNGKAQFGFSSATKGLDFKYHDASSYRTFAAQFDGATNFSDQRAAMQKFIGSVVDSTAKTKIAGFSPPVIVIPGL